MRASLAAALAVLAALASAQSSTTVTSTSASSAKSSSSSASKSSAMVTASSTVSQIMPPVATQGFNPALVESSMKSAWCTSQLNTCPEICGGSTSANRCDDTQLTYTCICGNGTAPDVTAYMGTLPFLICQETYGQCINNHKDDLDGQKVCTANEQCGTLNATSADATSSSAAASSAAATSSSSGGAAPSSTGSGSSPSSTGTGNAAASLNAELATGVFAGLLFAVFRLLL